MKTRRIRVKIRDYLKERPRNTAEIMEHINSTMRHGTTSQQLGNVLSKDKHTFKLGEVRRSGILSGAYGICEWGTSEWVIENQNPENPSEIVYQPSAGNPKIYFLSESDVERVRTLQESGLEELVV